MMKSKRCNGLIIEWNDENFTMILALSLGIHQGFFVPRSFLAFWLRPMIVNVNCIY